MSKRSRFSSRAVTTLLIALMAACSGRSCAGGGCQRAETCDECVQRCVETQGVSPEACRAGCGSICNK